MPTTHGRIRSATKYWQHPHSERSNDKLNFRFKLQRDRYFPPIPQHGLQGKASTHVEKRKESHRSHKQGWQPRKRHFKGSLNRRDIKGNWTRQRTFRICQEPKNWAIEMCCAGNQNQNPDPSRETNSPSKLWYKNKKVLPRNPPYAESGGPPSKEYKQSRAEHSKSSSWLHKRKSF